MKASPSTSPPPELPTTPEVVNSSASVEHADAVPDAAPAPPIALAIWPTWHRNVDLAIAVFVVVTAFLVASYTARNTDFFRHLASGRLMAKGQYPVGGDPFTFTAADRPWVNANWLFDLGFYAVYSADPNGAIAVVVKALAFAAAISFLFLLRKPAQSLWPWAALAGLAIVAIAGQTQLRPAVFGFLFQVLTFVGIYRLRWDQSKWRSPLLLGGLFAIWANTDSFAFLGPLTVLVVLLGEKLQAALMPVSANATDDAFFAPPPTAALWRAFGIGIVAILLNPTFLGGLTRDPGEAIAQLVPSELCNRPAALDADRALQIHGLSPLESAYFTNELLGYNLGGWITLGLLALAALVMSVDFNRIRITHVLFWIVFGALAARHYRFLPYFILAVLPVTAAHINGFSSWFRLGTVADQRTRLLLTGCGVGRILTLTLAIVLLAAALPGRLHPPAPNPAYARWVAWNVEVDTGLARGLEQIQAWRADGRLPADIHGLTIHLDFADYAAWFAPSEKPFINSRLRLHRKELVDLLQLRSQVTTANMDNRELTPRNQQVVALLDKYTASYVGMGQLQRRLDGFPLMNLMSDLVTSDNEVLPIWYWNGRSAILGRSDSPESRALTEKLRFHVAAATFGPQASTIPIGTVSQPPQPVDNWLLEYLSRPQPGSNETDESLFLSIYSDILRTTLDQRWQLTINRRLMLGGIFGGSPIFGLMRSSVTQRFPTDDELALPIAAARAARRGIAASPDHPESYLALAQAYVSQHMPEAQSGENMMQELTAITRFLARCPQRGKVNASDNVAKNHANDVVRQSFRAAQLLLRPRPQTAGISIDLALQHLQLAREYLPLMDDNNLQTMPPLLFELRMRLSLLSRKPLDTDQDWLQLLNPKRGMADANAWQSTIRQVFNDFGITIDDKSFNKLGEAAVKAEKRLDVTLVRGAIDRLVADLTELKQRRSDEVISKTARQNLATRTGVMVAAGLPATAIDLAKQEMRSKTQSPAEIGVHPYNLFANVIDNELRSGQLEQAAIDLKELLEESRKEADNRPDDRFLQEFRQRAKQLEGLQARLEGDFPLAARLLEEQVGKQLPHLSEKELALIKSRATSQPDLLGGVIGAPLGWSQLVSTSRVFDVVMGVGFYHLEHGLLALHEGDVVTARRSLERAIRPEGIELIRLGVPQAQQAGQTAAIYFGLLEKYKAK